MISSSSPLSALPGAKNKTTIPYSFLLVAVGVVIIAILVSSIFTMLSPLLPNQQSAFGTFPGENGRIAFYRYIGATSHIFTMNADGSDQIDLSNNHYDWDPDWSPDGTKVAFVNAYPGPPPRDQIFVMNAADGSEVTRLTDHPSNDRFPDWSPDGTKIIFTSGRNFRAADIFVMNAADGSDETNLTILSSNLGEYGSWSPDGSKIAFSYSDAIYVMNAADPTDVTRLIQDPTSKLHVDWGPPVEVEDTAPPVITVPEDITAEATGPDGAEVSFEEVSAEDNVDEAVDVNCDYDSGDTFPIGETDVTCIAEDTAGNNYNPKKKSYTLYGILTWTLDSNLLSVLLPTTTTTTPPPPQLMTIFYHTTYRSFRKLVTGV